MTHSITVESGKSIRLLTEGKYCDRDIIITAEGGGGGTEPDPRDDYQRVEYITSDGSCYVITDFIADNTCGVELVASFAKLEDKPPMGSRVDTGATRFYCVYPLSAQSCYYGFNGGYTITCGLTVDTIYRLQTNFMNSRLVNIIDATGVRKGGTNISGTLAQQNVPVSIFGYHHGGTNTINSVRQYTLYSARISKGNDIVREYIPCYRKSDGVIGLYENFTGEFLTAQGGAFTKGADVEWEYTSSGASVKTIVFGINYGDFIKLYDAESGMTWAEWVDSGYNTIGAYVDEVDNVIWYSFEDEEGTLWEGIIYGEYGDCPSSTEAIADKAMYVAG